MLTDAERTAARDAVRALSLAGEPVRSPAGGPATADPDTLHGLLPAVRRLARESPKPAADVLFCASALKRAERSLIASGALEPLAAFLVRSVTLEPVLPAIAVEAALAGFALDLQMGGYGSYVDDLMNPGSQLYRGNPGLVIIVLDLEDVAGALPDVCAGGDEQAVRSEIDSAIASVSGLVRSLRERSRARVVLQGFVLPERTSLGDIAEANVTGGLRDAVGQLNSAFAGVCRSVSGCAFFDVDAVASRFGRGRWSDARMFLASRLPLASEAFPVYAAGLVRTVAALFRPARKVLCTDLDQTFWGGILGEEGPEGIATGSAFPGNCYREYQRYLKQLRARGVLLAAVSKNNEADVREAFQLRAADLVLTLEDFAALKISWDDKVNALRELAVALSLGLDSFVFVDDNPVECAAVRQALPEVAVVQVLPEQPWRTVELLASESFFDVLHVTEDDRNRSGEYRAQTQREALAAQTSTREEFLASLGIVCTFVPAVDAPLARSVQMLAKTNQFNLTTRRHSAADVERFAREHGGQAVAMRVRDRFGDAGVVGLALARTEGDVCRIDTLLLSCRVIGRGVETALLALVAEKAQRDGARLLVGEYIPTKKNGLCASFYPDHGFSLRSQTTADDGSQLFELELHGRAGAPSLSSPSWLTVEHTATLEGTPSYELASAHLAS